MFIVYKRSYKRDLCMLRWGFIKENKKVRKQESKKTRKHAFDQESDQEKKKKKERKHALDQECDQEKRITTKKKRIEKIRSRPRKRPKKKKNFPFFFLLSCFLL